MSRSNPSPWSVNKIITSNDWERGKQTRSLIGKNKSIQRKIIIWFLHKSTLIVLGHYHHANKKKWFTNGHNMNPRYVLLCYKSIKRNLAEDNLLFHHPDFSLFVRSVEFLFKGRTQIFALFCSVALKQRRLLLSWASPFRCLLCAFIFKSHFAKIWIWNNRLILQYLSEDELENGVNQRWSNQMSTRDCIVLVVFCLQSTLRLVFWGV